MEGVIVVVVVVVVFSTAIQFSNKVRYWRKLGAELGDVDASGMPGTRRHAWARPSTLELSSLSFMVDPTSRR